MVVAREDKSGGKRLVAYLVANEEAPGVQEFREYLKGNRRIMVPSAFVVLDALPLTPNGKVDRRALPEPGRERPELSVEFVARKRRWKKSWLRSGSICSAPTASASTTTSSNWAVTRCSQRNWLAPA